MWLGVVIFSGRCECNPKAVGQRIPLYLDPSGKYILNQEISIKLTPPFGRDVIFYELKRMLAAREEIYFL